MKSNIRISVEFEDGKHETLVPITCDGDVLVCNFETPVTVKDGEELLIELVAENAEPGEPTASVKTDGDGQ